MMPPSGAKGGGVAAGHAYQTYQDFSSYEDDGQNMAAGFQGGYADGGYDAAYDDEYPPQQPYPHPGIRGLQYGGDGRQYAAGGVPGPPQWGYEEEGYGAYGDEEVEDLDNRMAQMTAEQRQAAMEAAQRSQSSKRYQEMERERKRRQLKTAGGSEKTSFFQATKLSLMNSGLIPLKKAEEDEANVQLYEKPVPENDFVRHCVQRRKYPVLLKMEFNNAVKENNQHSLRHGSKKANMEKNQNPRIIPYDFNRVVLEPEEGVPDSDYVNASYVDSLVQPKAYIVTQGPTESTMPDFWRMAWQEKASCIVMVTRTFDFIRVMCVQYWPAAKNREEVYGGVGITVELEEQLANFMIRTIRLRKDGEERKVIQFHYTEWPCHSNPFSNALLEFRRRVRQVMNQHPETQDGPVIVHCNDGAGRSGVYIAIDANIELCEEDGVFDVYGYLKKMRGLRRGLVETQEQYKFVYDTLEEYVVCGTSFFYVQELSERLKQKSLKDRETKKHPNEYEKEYGLICNQTPRFTIGDCAAGHRADNRDKNRNVLIVPPDNFRPYITSFQGNNCTDYINAVFVDGYTHPREYIVTEWPVVSTCSDLWSLVYDHDCSAVVVLCNPSPGVSNSYPSFWPENQKSKKYGQVFTVEYVSHNHYPNIRSWIFKINKKIVSLTELMAGVKAPSKTCQLFQLMCWPQGYKVPTSTNALVELMNMVERWRQRTDYGPVVVVSQDGISRCGVYCAANACIEQVIQHGEVDVFQAVKTVRRHRPQLVENLTEYKYCYDLVLHYVLHYLHKEQTK
eukprot:GFUD01033593.1.p1 GENE.GFUD01033593.1~~GFUD01033593.1.p1  ORF type:complete len:788 (+),score=174.32 GFUD01033593.1:281-2644(+)